MKGLDEDFGTDRPDRAGGKPPRGLDREARTLTIIAAIYCRDHHAGARSRREGELCSECAALAGYARRRLAACPYGAGKPACSDCRPHCYAPAMREQVRAVMRYAGPRMIREHPMLAVAHLLVRRRKVHGGP